MPNAVYLYDDKLVIAFNYKEATKTVSLKEVNGSIIECSGAPKKTDCFDTNVSEWAVFSLQNIEFSLNYVIIS